MTITPKDTSRQAGFALIEAVVVVVILAGIAGAGWYVAQHHTSTPAPTNNTEASTASTEPKVTAQPGTAARVIQLAQQSAWIDANNSQQNDNAETQAALSANSAASSMEGAYDESTL